MEILKTVPLAAEIELAGVAPKPDKSQFPTFSPEFETAVTRIELGELLPELQGLRRATKRDKRDKAAVYYIDHINGNGTYPYPSSKNPFSEDERGVIKVEIDGPEVNPLNPNKYLPKTRSVNVVAVSTTTEMLPYYDVLRYVLLGRNHFKSTGLVLMDTPKNRYGLARTKDSPQANKRRVDFIIGNMKAREIQLMHGNGKIDMRMYRATILHEALRSYGVLFFHGLPQDKHLVISSPRNHAS